MFLHLGGVRAETWEAAGRACMGREVPIKSIVAVRLEAEGCGEHWPVHVDIQGGTWSAGIEVQAAKSSM
jgi:hypothetical protein